MSDHDPFSRLLGSLRRQRQTDKSDIDFGTQPKADGERGLNPLDLLALPAEQRDLVNVLSRQKQANIAEIQAKLNLPLAKLMAAITALVETGYLHQALLDGEVYYRVVFGGKVKRAGRSVPQAIWDAVDLDNAVFLKQIPLFEHLSDEERHLVASTTNSRRYKRNEVILWQGNVGDGIYLIKSGIVGISRLTPDERYNDNTEMLAYLKQGDILGEHNLSSHHNLAATATATALSEVELLLIRREDFLDVLLRYDIAALRLAQMLSGRLVNLNGRLSSKGADVKLSMVFDAGGGATTIGMTLAMVLANTTGRNAVYTEHPYPLQLVSNLALAGTDEIYPQHGGFDVAVIEGTVGLPPSVRTTLVVDRLFSDYANVVVGLPDRIDESMVYMLEKANQVIILANPTEAERTQRLSTQLRSHIHPERTSVLMVVTETSAPQASTAISGDYVIPHIAEMPPLGELAVDNVPAVLADVATRLADRLGRTNQIGVYIPTTMDVDTVVDTTLYIDRTKAFLGKLFGGATATSNTAHGVWNSEDVGLVSEDIYIVRTFVTQTELDRYLGDVLEFVEGLKEELSQEAMAVEVNQKLMLI